MKFKILDRILLLNLLPQQADIVTLRIIKDIKERVELSAKEMEEVKMEQVEASLKWSPEKDISKEIELSEVETKLIKEKLKEANDNKKLTLQHVPLYDMFLVEKDK